MTNSTKEIVLELIQSGKAHTQQEICDALLQKGIEVNQTKISRLLHKIGAIKVKDTEGRLVYHLAQEHTPPKKNMLISELVLEVQSNQNLIVVHTQPGSAGMISRLIDFNKNDLGILATLAGDDTLFVAPADIKDIPQILPKLTALLSQ